MKYAGIVALLLILSACHAEDGRVYVKSDPAGAEINVLAGGDKEVYTSTDQKTPALITLPQGEQKVLLKLAGYKDTYLSIKVEGTAIIKPDPVKMDMAKVALDVLYSDDGWSVMIDKKVVNDASGKPAVAPCTIPVTLGKHEITFSKSGYNDMTTQMEIGKDVVSAKLDVDKAGLKPTKGKVDVKDKTVSAPAPAIKAVGKYSAEGPNWSGVVTIKQDGSFIGGGKNPNGKWELDGQNLKLIWDHWPPETLHADANGVFKDDALVLTPKK